MPNVRIHSLHSLLCVPICVRKICKYREVFVWMQNFRMINGHVRTERLSTVVGHTAIKTFFEQLQMTIHHMNIKSSEHIAINDSSHK